MIDLNDVFSTLQSQANVLTIKIEQEPLPDRAVPHDIRNMETSAIEALISLAGQDNKMMTRLPSPPPIFATPQPPPPVVNSNIIRTIQHMSDRYITNEPILKDSEKIEMFSEIPTDSEEESLEIRRMR